MKFTFAFAPLRRCADVITIFRLGADRFAYKWLAKIEVASRLMAWQLRLRMKNAPACVRTWKPVAEPKSRIDMFLAERHRRCRPTEEKNPNPTKSGTHFTSECALIVNLFVAFLFSLQFDHRWDRRRANQMLLFYIYPYFLDWVFCVGWMVAVGSFVFYRKHNKETSKNKTHANTRRSKEHSV